MKTAAAIVLWMAAALSAHAAFDVAPQQVGPTSSLSYTPIVASNGNGFLAAWAESSPIGGIEIRGALIGPEGQVLTQQTFVIGSYAEFAGATVTAVGSKYLVVGYSLATSTPHTTMISPDGTVTREAIPIPFARAYSPAVASIGNEIMLVANTGGSALSAHFLRTDGTLLRSETLGAATRWAATDGENEYVVAATEGSSIVSYRFSAAGVLMERLVLATVAPETVAIYLTVSHGDGGFVVAWAETLGFSARMNVRVAAVRSNGTITVTEPTALAGDRVDGVSVVWTGTEYLLAVKRSNDADATRITSLGTLVGAPAKIEGGNALASNRSISYSVGLRDCCGPVVGVPVRTEATVAPGTAEILNQGAQMQRVSAFASDGTDFLAVWRHSDTLSRRVGRDGDPAQNSINALPGAAVPVDDGLAFAGSTYLQLSNQEILYGQRLSKSGTAIGSPIPIRSGASHPVVTAAGDRFFVAWQEQSGSYSAFINTDGTMSEPRLLLDPKQPVTIHDVAFDGQTFVVLLLRPSPIWGDPVPPPPDLMAIRAGLDGSPLDSEPILLLSSVDRAHIASNGRDFAVVADRGHEVNLVRIKTAGTALQISKRSVLTRETWWPRSAVTWDGRDYVVAWTTGSGSFVEPSRLSLARFDGKGLGSTTRTIEIGPTAAPIAIAGNKIGDVVILISETREAGVAPRLRTYSERDFPAR